MRIMGKPQGLKSKHLKTINFFLILLLLFNAAQIYNNLAVYSQNATTVPAPEPPKDFITYIFENSLTSMLLSTFIIGIVGVLINKLRVFKKKLDMIEILTKSQIQLKRQAEKREQDFEERFVKSQTEVRDEITKLCQKVDIKSQELERRIDNVKEDATNVLIKYLSENRRN